MHAQPRVKGWFAVGVRAELLGTLIGALGGPVAVFPWRDHLAFAFALALTLAHSFADGVVVLVVVP